MSGTSYADALNAALRGGGTTGKAATVTTVGQFLELYVVHFIITCVFIAGGIILIDRYANAISGPFTAWDDMFFAIGALATAINAGFLIALLIAWINHSASALSREDSSIHWLHALSILAAASAVIWGVLALILTFSSALAGSVADDVEVAGYFMVMLSVAYCAFITIRYILGLSGSKDVAAAGVIQPPTTLDYQQILAASRAASANAAYSQPIFGGAGGAAAFGGIDLSGLQPSSMSTLPPTQAAHSAAPSCAPGGYPMMIIPQMMMGPSPAQCADPNAVQIS